MAFLKKSDFQIVKLTNKLWEAISFERITLQYPASIRPLPLQLNTEIDGIEDVKQQFRAQELIR